jgi:hypothetical protein
MPAASDGGKEVCKFCKHMDKKKCGCYGGWYDPSTGERGPWPRPLKDYDKIVKLRGGKTKTVHCEEFEYPAGTDGGRFQLWIDGKWAGNITKEKEASKGPDMMPSYSRDFTEEFVDAVGLDDKRSPADKERAMKAWLSKLKEQGDESDDE